MDTRGGSATSRASHAAARHYKLTPPTCELPSPCPQPAHLRHNGVGLQADHQITIHCVQPRAGAALRRQLLPHLRSSDWWVSQTAVSVRGVKLLYQCAWNQAVHCRVPKCMPPAPRAGLRLAARVPRVPATSAAHKPTPGRQCASPGPPVGPHPSCPSTAGQHRGAGQVTLRVCGWPVQEASPHTLLPIPLLRPTAAETRHTGSEPVRPAICSPPPRYTPPPHSARTLRPHLDFGCGQCRQGLDFGREVALVRAPNQLEVIWAGAVGRHLFDDFGGGGQQRHAPHGGTCVWRQACSGSRGGAA